MKLALDATRGAKEPYAWTLWQLGKLSWAVGDVEQAGAYYQQALDVFPGYVYALDALAQVEAARGNTDACDRVVEPRCRDDSASAVCHRPRRPPSRRPERRARTAAVRSHGRDPPALRRERRESRSRDVGLLLGPPDPAARSARAREAGLARQTRDLRRRCAWPGRSCRTTGARRGCPTRRARSASARGMRTFTSIAACSSAASGTQGGARAGFRRRST